MDKRRGGLFISGFTELLNASWEEGEIQRGRVLRKASVITFSFEPPFVPSYAHFYCAADYNHKCYQIKSATLTQNDFELSVNCKFESSNRCKCKCAHDGSVGVGELKLCRPGLKPA